MTAFNGHRRPSILIVDDDPSLAEMLARALEEDGYEVALCGDSLDAVRKAKEIQPDAVILDVLMPNADGFEVLRQLRSTPAGRTIPVVLMSAAWRAVDLHRDIGATHNNAPTVVLPKPFRLTDLERSLTLLGVRTR